jgi:carboxymethylenebutenolidase
MRRHSFKLLFLPLLLSLFALPAQAQDWAKAALEKSPRHREFVTIQHDGRSLQAYVVYPEVSHKATVVVLIHEIFGLTDWAKEMADELAAAGYIVVAPDLLSGLGPNGAGSADFSGREASMKAVSGLDPNGVTADLNASADYGKKLPSANGKLAVVGFCWGGGKTFLFATHRKDLAAAFVFYGPPPPDVTAITAPVYGFYAGNDARISSTIPDTITAMKAAGKKYDPVVYDGAGHGFMREGEDPSPNTTAANKNARAEAFTRLTSLLKQIDAQTSSHLTPIASHLEAASLNATSVVAKQQVAACH